MCKRVGVNIKTVDLSKKDWFLQHEWTQEQERVLSMERTTPYG